MCAPSASACACIYTSLLQFSDSTLDVVERDVSFSLQVVFFFRLSLKVQGGGYAAFLNFEFMISEFLLGG